MFANSFGTHFRVTTFGESHGVALGCVIDGCPSGVRITEAEIQADLNRRRPGQSAITTARNEADQVEILSGIFQELTLGTPIAMIVRNTDQRSDDYTLIKAAPRQGHADLTWRLKFGHTDHRGGGRSSGRETLTRVMAAAVAKKLIPGIPIVGFASRIGPYEDPTAFDQALAVGTAGVDRHTTRMIDAVISAEAEKLLQQAKSSGDSYGGTVSVVADVPAGLGQPVFRKLKADLGQALLSIGAVEGVTISDDVSVHGHAAGTEFHVGEQRYGGILGGISTGGLITAHVHFKPTSSILDVAKKGRHDPCIVIRAVPVVEAMVALVLADQQLARQTDRIAYIETHD